MRLEANAAADEGSAPSPRTGHVAVTIGRSAMKILGSTGLAGAPGPSLLVHGGMTHDGKVLADTWLLEPVFASATDDN